MPKLNDMPEIIQVLIKGTLKSLDGENMSCLNMIGLCNAVLDGDIGKNSDTAHAIADVFQRYWSARQCMMENIHIVLDVLCLSGDEVDTFRRHNYLKIDQSHHAAEAPA